MATIAMPTTPGFKVMRLTYRRMSALVMSPYNFTQQVAVWPGKMKMVEVELPPMTEAQADDWIDFMDDLNGFENTFQMDLSDAFPNETGLSAVEMRLMEPDQSWDLNEVRHYGMTFKAMEAL